MALKQTIRSQYGFDMEYWRIAKYEIDIIKKEIHIEVMPYINSTVRFSGGSPIDSEKKRIDLYNNIPYKDDSVYDDHFAPDIMQSKGENIVALLYSYIKEYVKDFEGAQDC